MLAQARRPPIIILVVFFVGRNERITTADIVGQDSAHIYRKPRSILSQLMIYGIPGELIGNLIQRSAIIAWHVAIQELIVKLLPLAGNSSTHTDKTDTAG